MLHLTQETQILIAIEPIDFRKQIDGLIALCEQTLQFNPRSGQLFAFINRSRTMIRVLCYESGGYWLATKRLSRGRYTQWPNQKNVLSRSMIASEFTTLLKQFVAWQKKPR